MTPLRAWIAGSVAVAATVGLSVTIAPGCIFELTQTSIGQGTGCVTGALNVPTCWAGQFNLQPDFFAAVPYMNTLQIRIQRGSDYETFSDGLSILIDDITAIRPSADAGSGAYGQPLPVSISAGVTPPGVPLQANPHPSLVHMVLYLQHTCQVQNVALYALDQVTLSPDGSCNTIAPLFACGVTAPVGDAMADAALGDAGPAASDGGAGSAPIGHSTITFTSLFNNNVEETSASQRLSEATFDVYLADPRDVSPGGLGPPPVCKGHLQGRFRFYFQRGRPGQPFP